MALSIRRQTSFFSNYILCVMSKNFVCLWCNLPTSQTWKTLYGNDVYQSEKCVNCDWTLYCSNLKKSGITTKIITSNLDSSFLYQIHICPIVSGITTVDINVLLLEASFSIGISNHILHYSVIFNYISMSYRLAFGTYINTHGSPTSTYMGWPQMKMSKLAWML